MASKISYVGTRKTRNATYTPAARGGMLSAAERELRRFTKPQKINEAWWSRQLGFNQDYGKLTNGDTPWDTLRVMMSRNANEGKGVGSRFVRFKNGFITRSKYDQDPRWCRANYGKPVVAKRLPALKKKGLLTVCTTTCQCCGKKNDHVWYEAA